MKDYKAIVEQRRADHEQAAAEIRATIDENKAKIDKLYTTQAKSVVTGDSAAYSTAENEIKFLKATIDGKAAELEELNRSAVFFTRDEYHAAVLEAIRENAADYAATKQKIKEKWQEISDLYKAFRDQANRTNAQLKYLRGVSGTESSDSVNTGLEIAGWISESSSGMTYYQAFR